MIDGKKWKGIRFGGCRSGSARCLIVEPCYLAMSMRLYQTSMLACTFLAGCAFGNKQDYRQAQPSLAFSGVQKIAVGVQDQRPYVVNGNKDEDFVGLQRGGLGNPFDVRTQSKRALAEEMTNLLADALKHSGANVTPVRLPPSLSRDQVLSTLLAEKPDKSLLVTLYEWKSDTYVGSEIQYNVDMQAFGRSGKLLAEKRIEGIDQLGSAFWYPQGVAQDGAPAAFKKKMEEMYSGGIAKAITQTGESQIGLSNDQSPEDKYTRLAKLRKLLDDGTLTQQEFEAEKRRILEPD
ncbi:SHOCT domain-containing protein [Methylococcus capsulatus]|uniref:SHOCT domain-containing protein n=1 Tax=Methylococcus capsulatus TaxID=414 RepID=UPI00117F626D|nr:SHOCT domain-containing protein [Methylococcus capsulatus]